MKNYDIVCLLDDVATNFSFSSFYSSFGQLWAAPHSYTK